MKATTFLKVLVVLVAIGVIAYIIHNSNKAAKINNLVSAPIEQYEFSQHVDSMCNAIRNASEYANAKHTYHMLYDEIEVNSKIKTNTGESLMNMSEYDQLYEKAFEAYWPEFSNEADNLFAKNDWNPSRDFKNEVTYLLQRKGVDPIQNEILVTFNRYISGRARFERLLGKAEKCKDADTYNDLSKLEDYVDFPYNNLKKMQDRRKRAKSMAKASWERHIDRQYQTILEDGKVKLNQSEVPWQEVSNFNYQRNEWGTKVYSFRETVPDQEYAYSNELQTLEDLYQLLFDKYRSLDPSNFEIPWRFKQSL